ncbi:Uncharacterised protein g5674 [Pycnogonum litorale]
MGAKWSMKETWKACSVEPVMLIHSIVYYMMMPVIQNFIMDKLCLENGKVIDPNSNRCGNTSDEPGNLREIDSSTANYLMYHTLVQVVPGAIFCVFLGSWSDTHGRRLPLILPTFGSLLSQLGLLLLVFFDNDATALVLVATLPYGILGGPVTFAMAIYSYLADITGTSCRMLRLSILDGISFVGGPIGAFVGGTLKHHFGYESVFVTAMCLDFAMILYTYFVVDETVQDLGAYSGHYYKDIVKIGSFLKTFKAVFRKRDFNAHSIVKVILVNHCVISVALRGEEMIGYLYVHAKFGWSLSVYTVFIGYYMLMCIVGLILTVPLFSWKLKVSDSRLGSVGCISRFIASVFIALSTNTLMVFVAATIGLLSNLATVSVRSIISKVVEPDEVGKAFAMMSMFEAISPIAASILYSQLYRVSISNFPELVYLLSAALVSIAFFCFGWLRKNIKPELTGDLDLGEKRPLLEELDFQDDTI